MPDAALTQAIKEAYASAPAAEMVLHTLELRHPAFDAPIRVVRDRVDLTARLEANAAANAGQMVLFKAMSFDFKLPDVTTNGQPEIEVSLDNVTSILMPYIDQAAQTNDLMLLTYRPYLLSDLSGPQMVPPLTLTLKNIRCDLMRVSATAGFPELALRKFPSEIYTQTRFAGLLP
jgi:Domain of unknown function (DUF1833)